MKASQFVMPDINQMIVGRFVGLPNGPARARLWVRNLFTSLNPKPVIEEELEVAGERVAQARNLERRTQAQELATQLYGVAEEPDPDATRNPVEFWTGMVALPILIIAVLIVPSMAAMLIVEAKKIAIVADYPLAGGIFGVSALVGICAAIEWRAHLNSDDARQRFDRRLLVAAIGAFLVWSASLALAAYPLDFSEGAGAGIGAAQDWSLLAETPPNSSEPGFRFETHMAWLFTITAVLDLLAAPTLHRFFVRRLTPRPVKRILVDAEREHLSLEAGPEAAAQTDEALQELKNLRAADEAWNAALASFEERTVALFEALSAEAEDAGRIASRQVLKAIPQKQANGDARGPLDLHA